MLRSLRPYALLFLFLTGVYHSNLRPIASGDSLGASLIPFSIILDGSVNLDRFGPYLTGTVAHGPAIVRHIGGHWYSTYPIAGPALLTPLYLPVARFPGFPNLSAPVIVAIARIMEKFAAVTLAALTAALLLLTLRRFATNRAAWLLTLVFALGTANWSTASQALWQHTFGQLAILGCLYSIVRWSDRAAAARWYWLAGLSAAVGVLIRPTNVALLPALALALWFLPAPPKRAIPVVLPPILAALGVAAFNYTVFQNLAGGYPSRLDGDFPSGLLGVLFSPARGLFLYTPVALFALSAFTRSAAPGHRPLIAAATTFCLLHIAIVAAWNNWWGGYCWGPRLLTEIIPPIMLLIAIGLPAIQTPKWKPAFIVLAAWGIFIQALGVYCYPKGRWDHTPVPVNEASSRLWDWSDNPIARTARGGLAWEPYVLVFTAVTEGPRAAAAKLSQLGINPY